MLDVRKLAETLALGSLLDDLRQRAGAYELLAHWKQGEFHHDVVLRVEREVLVVATNCNGGVKEVLAFDDVPDRRALWGFRCPDSPDFGGPLPTLLARARTHHWFDPCSLLAPDARSELRPEHRRRQEGGGWEALPSACGPRADDEPKEPET